MYTYKTRFTPMYVSPVCECNIIVLTVSLTCHYNLMTVRPEAHLSLLFPSYYK